MGIKPIVYPGVPVAQDFDQDQIRDPIPARDDLDLEYDFATDVAVTDTIVRYAHVSEIVNIAIRTGYFEHYRASARFFELLHMCDRVMHSMFGTFEHTREENLEFIMYINTSINMIVNVLMDVQHGN